MENFLIQITYNFLCNSALLQKPDLHFRRKYYVVIEYVQSLA